MTVERAIAREIADRLLDGADEQKRLQNLAPRSVKEEPAHPHMPAGGDPGPEGLALRRQYLRDLGHSLDALSIDTGEDLPPLIENHIGHARIPIGVIGPLRINGGAAHGDYHVPLATSEGALVASYNRGAYAITRSGGAASLCLTEVVSRAPCFCFASMAESLRFLSWVLEHFETFRTIAAGTTRHGKLTDMRTSLIGKEVYLIFDYHTGDAAGQNMVTFATDAICRHLVAESPVPPERWYIEGNLSGDKKATMLSYLYARGRKAIAEVELPAKVLSRILHTNAREMVRYWEISFLGGTQSGSIGVQGHYANALAALFTACGQDIACVSEASVGLTRMEARADDSLYVSVVLPNLIVGTVGGGTGLPTARECLDMIGCRGEGGARKFAEICAATVLAGEISIIAAMAAGQFADAHRRLGRPHRKAQDSPAS